MDIEVFRKQLFFRCRHRGTKEMDYLIGSFAQKYIHNYNLQELQQLEQVISQTDDDLYAWLLKHKDAPSEVKNDIFKQLQEFVKTKEDFADLYRGDLKIHA